MMGWNESGFCSLSDFCSFGKFINSLMESGGEGADGNVRANELEGGWQRVQINVFFQIVQIYLSDFSKFGKGFGRAQIK